MSFSQKTWANGSTGGTPITASDLNRIEQGVADASTAIAALPTSYVQQSEGTTGQVYGIKSDGTTGLIDQSGGLSATDNGDGTFTISGSAVTDNGDGTFTIGGI